jgi:drug/metabolite transporter (DMT)-like permease
MLVQPPALFGGMLKKPTSNYSTYISPCKRNGSDILDSILGSDNHTDDDPGIGKNEQVVGYLLCVLAAVFAALLTQVMNHKLQDTDIYTYMFYASIIGGPISFTVMGFTEEPFFPSHPTCAAFMFTHIMTAGATGFCILRALQLANPVNLMLIYVVQIPFLFVLQYTGVPGLVIGDFDTLEIFGALFVIIGNILSPTWTLLRERNIIPDCHKG